MDAKFTWLERTTTPDGVYRVLRAAILDGTVPAGGQLREAHIAADLGISRSPLREALRLYLTMDYRTYSDPHDIAVEHERLAAIALEGAMDGFRQELARHFQSALRA